MKCPDCNAKVTSSAYQSETGIYICSNCRAHLKRRLSTPWFIAFLIIGLPIIELPVRLIVEPIVFAHDLRSHLGTLLPYVISFMFAFAAAFVAYRVFDDLVPTGGGAEKASDTAAGPS